MVRSLWSAATGMIAQQTNVDTIANNLANVNTIGYKSEVAEFKSLLYQRVRLCKELVDRLFEINRTINFAAKNKDYRLPYSEYKSLCNERDTIRQVLKEAKWEIYNYST